jgi:DNA-binding XRE family transcriptional regulator
MEACHNNGVKTDNRLTNLRWDTPSSNQLDRQKHGTFAPFGLKGESHHFATLTDSQVLKIREEYAKGNTTQTALAKQYSVSQHTISNIVLEKTRSTKRFV